MNDKPNSGSARARRSQSHSEAGQTGDTYLRAVWEITTDAMALSTPDGTVVEANPAYYALYGYSAEEVLGKNFAIIFPPEERALARQQYKDVFANPAIPPQYEATIRRKNGETRTVESRIAFITENGQRTHMLSVIRDITTHKAAVEAIQRSEQLYRSLASNLPSGAAFLVDRDLRYILAEGQALRNSGYTSQDFEGKTIREAVEPELAAIIEANIRQALRGEPFQVEHMVHDRYYVTRGIPLCDAQGQAFAALAVSYDITERRQSEKDMRFYANSLEQSLQTLQEFATFASHDLQEPLRKVRAFAQLLGARSENLLDEDGRDYLARIISAAERMDKMLQSLLSYSRVNTQREDFVEVDLSQVAQDVLSDLEVRMEESHGSVELERLPVVHGDPQQLAQLLQNLIGNALKYRRADTPPRVKVSSQPRGADYIELLVQDNGIGIQPQNSQRIFQPFVRLHGRSEYEGTGMGLAICQKIVERHGGTITVQSTPGEGSTFCVVLPASA